MSTSEPEKVQDTANVSWLKLGLARLSPELDEIATRTVKRTGYANNAQSVTAHRPALMKAQDAMSQAVNRVEDSGLSFKERELIALVVSVENRCEPCVFGHAARLREITGDPVWVGQVEVNYRRAALSARERAIADYAFLMTRRPHEIEPADLDRLRANGLSDRDILDAAAIAAYFNFSNRLNSSLGIEPEHMAYTVHR